MRVSAQSSNGQALFVGIAPQDAVNAYLGSVNWYEIAEHYLSEVEEEEATE